MNNLYDNMAKTALRMISEKGRPVVVEMHAARPSYDPALGVVTNNPVQRTVKAVVSDYKQSEVDGTLIQSGDKKMMIAADALDLDISTSSTIKDGNDTYSVVDVLTIKPATKTILFKAQCRLIGG